MIQIMPNQVISMGIEDDIFHVNIIEQFHISPPQESLIPPIKLPLTYFDIPWLFYSPNQTLFFYQTPPNWNKFITTLKQSLSLALKHFYPLAGNLIVPPPPTEPYISYQNGDSVSFTIAKTNVTIDYLSGNHPRSITNLSSLVTRLPSPCMINNYVLPLLAIQVTLFNNDSGLSIGVTSQHAAADERTLYAFMNHWASLCNESSFKNISNYPSPWFDRSVILDPISLKTTLLKQWWNRPKNSYSSFEEQKLVQSTFYLTPSDINKIKQHVVTKCKMLNEDPPLNLSLYETGACYTWICLLKLDQKTSFYHDAISDDTLYLGYNASGISRLKYDIPFSYFGCCIVFGRFGALESELLGENGLVCATQSFEKEIDRLVRDFLQGGENWIKDWNELNLRIIGSPKVDFYGIDFGVGKATKIEKVSGDNHGRVHVMTMNGGREIMDGGLEIGVVLSKDKMTAFTTLFNNGLMELAQRC